MFRRLVTERTVVRLCVFLLLSTLGLIAPTAAIATDSPTDPVTLSSEYFASIYMDAPFVQASYASNADAGATNVQTENFETLTAIPSDYATSQGADGNCPENIGVGTVSPTSACLLYANDPNFGGATTSSSEPVDFGPHSTYAAVHSGVPLTITFPSVKKYVGFWWSAGSYGNNISFLDQSGTVLAQLNADDIYNAVSANPITALSGTKYLSSKYLGHPGDPTTDESGNPITDESGNPIRYDSIEPFVYIHAFSPTGFYSIQLSAPVNGFEFDNLTTADTAPRVDQRLVPVRDIYASQVLPTPSPNPGYEFRGWYSDPVFENYTGMPGDTYYPASASSTLYPQWSFLFDPTFTDIAPATGPIGTWVNLKGNQISRSSGDYGWQTIYFKAFDNAGNLISGTSWNTLPGEYIRDHSGNESVDVRIQSDLPAGTQTVKYHVDACPNWAHPEWGGCVPLDNAAQFTITVPAPYTFTYTAGSHGTVIGNSSQTVNAGSNGTPLIAVADSGYYFVNWSDGSTANPRTDTNAMSDISVTANFGLNGGGGGGSGGGGGGGGSGGYSPPSPPETIIIIPPLPTQPVIVQQPEKSSEKSKRKVTVSKEQSTTVIQIAPRPVITVGNSDIAIQGLNKGQYIRVTVTGLNGTPQVITPSTNTELNTIINSNPKSNLKIEITPTLSSSLKTGARIGINGAKKNQRVRVTVQ